MSKRVTHYEDWDGGTEADQDHPETLFCGTDIGDPEMTPYKDQVTCKRCLNILAAGKAERMLEDQKYKSELYDEVWQRARDMGFANVTMALAKLTEQPAPVTVVLPERLAQILKFLEGAENLDGYWFGEPGPHGSKVWWRAELRKALTETNLFAKQQ